MKRQLIIRHSKVPYWRANSTITSESKIIDFIYVSIFTVFYQSFYLSFINLSSFYLCFLLFIFITYLRQAINRTCTWCREEVRSYGSTCPGCYRSVPAPHRTAPSFHLDPPPGPRASCRSELQIPLRRRKLS